MIESADTSWVCVHMRPNSDVVQVTSNLADKQVAETYAESLEEIGGRVIAICSTVALILAVAEIKE